jgi:hypothetical protein
MGLGDSLKKWATSKATEMITTDRQKRDDAAASADAVETQTKNDVAETLLRTAFPKLGEFADQQKAAQVAREAAADQEHREEIAALPPATVHVSVTGLVTAMWAGQLHYKWNDVAPNDPDPSDPYADKPMLWFELFAEETAQPNIGGMMLTHWGIQIPGYHGDGTYDLTAIDRERETAGAGLDHLDCAMDFANSDESSFYFYADAGQSTATVSEGGKKLDVVIAMGGAAGDMTATATIQL